MSDEKLSLKRNSRRKVPKRIQNFNIFEENHHSRSFEKISHEKSSEKLKVRESSVCRDMETNTDQTTSLPGLTRKASGRIFINKTSKSKENVTKSVVPINFFPSFMPSRSLIVRRKLQGYVRKNTKFPFANEFSPLRKIQIIKKAFSKDAFSSQFTNDFFKFK